MQHQLQQMQQTLWMQQMAYGHQERMAQLYLSAGAHQARMDAIRAVGDAQLQSWHARQAASDAAHRRFMETLTGECDRDGRRRRR